MADFRKEDTAKAKAFWKIVRQTAEKAKNFPAVRVRQLGDDWLDSSRDVSTKQYPRWWERDVDEAELDPIGKELKRALEELSCRVANRRQDHFPSCVSLLMRTDDPDDWMRVVSALAAIITTLESYHARPNHQTISVRAFHFTKEDVDCAMDAYLSELSSFRG